MTAKQAAEYVKNNKCTVEDVAKLIPEYKWSFTNSTWILHRNAWISSFRKLIPEEMKGVFSALK